MKKREEKVAKAILFDVYGEEMFDIYEEEKMKLEKEAKSLATYLLSIVVIPVALFFFILLNFLDIMDNVAERVGKWTCEISRSEKRK